MRRRPPSPRRCSYFPSRSRRLGRSRVRLADLAAEVFDAVVNISAEIVEPKRGKLCQTDPNAPSFDEYFDDFLRRQQKLNPGLPEPPQEHHGAMGSGFVIDPSGIIVANNHVIAGANDITVNFTDGQKLKAEIIGKDEKVDVAVLRVKPEEAAEGRQIRRQREVARRRLGARGRQSFRARRLRLRRASSRARNRNIDKSPYDSYIQTDAAINKEIPAAPCSTWMAKSSASTRRSSRLPAIRSASASQRPPTPSRRSSRQLQKFGEARRGWLGVRMQGVDDAIAERARALAEQRGALVAAVDELRAQQGRGCEDRRSSSSNSTASRSRIRAICPRSSRRRRWVRPSTSSSFATARSEREW